MHSYSTRFFINLKKIYASVHFYTNKLITLSPKASDISQKGKTWAQSRLVGPSLLRINISN